MEVWQSDEKAADGARYGVFFFWSDCLNGFVQHAAFGGPDAADSPAGGGHFRDGAQLDIVLR